MTALIIPAWIALALVANRIHSRTRPDTAPFLSDAVREALNAGECADWVRGEDQRHNEVM